MTEQHKNLSAALAAFQAEMPSVGKNRRADVGQYSYTYADLADVSAAATPVLTKHGLAYAGSARHLEGGRYEVVGILSHESGEAREGALPLTGGSPQQMGSAITYMRRYLFGLMTGLVTDDDDDGQAAARAQQRAAERSRDTGEAMTDKSRAEMFALFTANLITEREQQLAGISTVLGRQVESRGDITEAECRRVIESLRARA